MWRDLISPERISRVNAMTCGCMIVDAPNATPREVAVSGLQPPSQDSLGVETAFER